MLWLALHLPHLALDCFARLEQPLPAPFAVYERRGSREQVHARNRAAARAGVAPGQTVAAALALCGGLALRPRDPAAEATALEGLALWATQFSDQVSLQPPDGLLVEIGGSLRLFGGHDPLRAQVDAGLTALGYHARLATAPTPLAAWWLALAGGATVAARTGLAAALAPLPLPLLGPGLGLAPPVLARLRGLGLQRIGDCRRLPRAGLARRFGPELLLALDRAHGERPDPRPRFAPPERFARTLWLPTEVEQTEALLFAARRLLLELAGRLRALDRGLRRFTLRLLPGRSPRDTIELSLVGPSRDPAHLLALLRERLARHELTAPVQGLALEADDFTPLEAPPPDLFRRHEPTAQWQPLVESLRARLGESAVHGLTTVADHRPAHAWRPCPPGADDALSPPAAPRPLWLLREPCRLPAPPRLLGPAERIESGWWTPARWAGDCYLAEMETGERIWVCRQGDGWVELGRF